MKCFGGLSVFPCHNLAPVGSEMVENTFYCVVGVTEVFFVEFFDVLFFDAINDALHANVGDHLLQVKFFLKFLCFLLMASG
jgi:hypothetical protein